jgi:hypothetical protein
MARAFKRSRTSNTGLGVDSVIRHVDPGTAAGQPASECLNCCAQRDRLPNAFRNVFRAENAQPCSAKVRPARTANQASTVSPFEEPPR